MEKILPTGDFVEGEATLPQAAAKDARGTLKSNNSAVGKRRRSSIQDVAKEAGVAISTVSAYLNGRPVRTKNRYQIEAAIGRLDYRPSVIAAAIKTHSTKLVGLMVPNLGEFHFSLLDHLSRRLSRVDRAVLFYCHDNDPVLVRKGLDFLTAHRVDSLIMDGRKDIDERIRSLIEHGTPIVFYDQDSPGLVVDKVLVHNRKASRRAVAHLLDIGHKSVGILAGNQSEFTGRERLSGYCDAIGARGVSVDGRLIIHAAWSERGGYDGALQLLSTLPRPTAIFSCNYAMTVGALACIRERGLRVPDDISVVSFDDGQLFRIHEAGITAVRQPIEQMAETITKMLLSRLENRIDTATQGAITFDCDIVLRGSTRRLSLFS